MKQRYDSYKPSGIDWIGDIPSHWKLSKIKFIGEIRGRIGFRGYTTADLVSEGEGALTIGGKHISNNVIDLTDPEYISWDKYYESPEIMVSKGDIVIAQRGTLKRTAYISKYIGPATINPSLVLLTNIKINPKYLHSYLCSNATTEFIDYLNTATAVPMISQNQIESIRILEPPLAEQEAIAAWLDEKCGEIDAAIAKVDREIELIDELKQSEISRIVTRGLNPDIPLRPSGIDWIGDIPEHWTIRKTAQIFHGIGSGTTPTSGSNKYYSEDGVNWLQTGDLNDGNINNTSKKITTTALTDFSSLKIYPKGSIVIAMYGATIGKLGKLNIETTTNQACCVLPKSNEIDNDFAFYVFWAGKRALINSAYGGGQPNISQDTIKSFKLALPPLSEQQAIADYLDKKCAEIDGLKAKLTKKREALAELRQSIISEVVTGKRKVI